MSASFGLKLGVSTSLKLTPQMQQAIKLLQLSSIELEQEVQAKLDSNPLLERDDADEFGADGAKSSDADNQFSDGLDEFNDSYDGNDYNNDAYGDDYHSEGFVKASKLERNKERDAHHDDAYTPDSLDKLHGGMDDDAIDSDWQSVYGDDVYYDTADMQDDAANFHGATSASIQDYVRWQMGFKNLSMLDGLIAEHLIDAMDESGFIRTTALQIANSFNTILTFYELDESVEENEVLAVLRIIQSCSPTGVGARDFVECLLIQLRYLPDDTPHKAHAQKVLEHANLLQSNNITALTRETKLSMDEIKDAMALIRRLSPDPAQEFAKNHQNSDNVQSMDIPDILVLAKNSDAKDAHGDNATSWQVMLNPETLPKLKINQEYASLIKRGDDSYQNTYLKENLADAKLFIKSIQERNQNLLAVASCIATMQQSFLLKGDKYMQPLILKDVAQKVGLHESTVSRLTTNKSMLTPQGLYPLKYFFSSHVLSDDGEVSSVAISAMIEEMIGAENPKKPLSDSKIMQALEQKGISIARRTVSKYREMMGIPSYFERKQKL